MSELDLPAGRDDFPRARPSWTAYLHNMFQAELLFVRSQYRPFDTYDATLPVHLVDPSVTEVPADAHFHTVTWSGFPRQFLVNARDAQRTPAADDPTDPYPMADAYGSIPFTNAQGEDRTQHYRMQEEYLEWHAEPGDGQPLTRITFTCEALDFWSCVGSGYPAPFFTLPKARRPEGRHEGLMEEVVAEYQSLCGDSTITEEDLVFREDMLLGGVPRFRAGDYNPWNEWNITRGIVHLSEPANAVFQALHTVGGASIRRTDTQGQLFQGAKSLLDAGGYGGVNRSSDPAIGAAVNELARAGYHVTMANPVGIYISHIEDHGWTKPDGTPVPHGYWRVERVKAGAPGLPNDAGTLRAVYEVPVGETYRDDDGEDRPMTLSDIHIGGRPLQHPGQIAEAVRMALTLVAWPKTPGDEPEVIGALPGSRWFTNRDRREDLRYSPYRYPTITLVPGENEVDAFPGVSASKDARAAYLVELGTRLDITESRDWSDMSLDTQEPEL